MGPPFAALARDHCAAVPEILVIQGDATALPFGEGSVDVAISVLTLHHLDRDAAVAAAWPRCAGRARRLRGQRSLRTRSRGGWCGSRPACSLASSRVPARWPALGPPRLHADELRVLAERAALGAFTIRRLPWLRGS